MNKKGGRDLSLCVLCTFVSLCEKKQAALPPPVCFWLLLNVGRLEDGSFEVVSGQITDKDGGRKIRRGTFG